IRDYENVFPWVWANMIEVGEATGKLPQCLDEIAAYQESAARIKGKVITAFMYPGILSVAVVCALIFLMIAVVPKFTIIFTEQKLQLPFITQVVIGISNLVRNNFPIVAIFGTVMTISIIYLKKIPKVQLLIDTAVLNLPVFGTIFVNVAVVRFSRSLGTLLRSGVQILRALEISGRLVENEFIETRIKQVAEAVKSGQGLGGQLESKKVFPVFMSQLITVGEESGDLERFLDLLANYYEEGVDTFLARLTTLLEPFLLIFMGGIIGTIVISLFLPIVQLSTGAGV
ncbi:MAG TPA: type II secretion system F family protein, partial [Candidatus Gracilibacteria bacterium]|nr:type II secretion system F family protein [Candidatus Gracilibacteria bacterium]